MYEPAPTSDLSRRERQIMDVLYRLGEGAVHDVVERIPDPPSYSSVRTMLRILEEKGHVQHVRKGLRYIYSPSLPETAAKKSALRHMLGTFFGGSTEAVVSELLDLRKDDLSDEELARLARLIERARKGDQP